MPTLIPNAFNLAVIAYVALGSMSCSYGMAVLSSIIGQPSFYTFFHLANRGHHHYSHTSNLLGALNGISCAGSAIGAAMCAWTADKFGRKWTIQVGAAILVVGGALCAGSVDMGMLLVARFIAGLGIGLLITAIPMYQAECSTPESRGFMVSMHGIMFAAGYSLAAWIGFGCYFISAKGSHSSVPWRFPLAFQAFPALLLLLGSFWLPKSPRWLLQQDRADEAFDVLRRLHKTASDPQETRSKREFFQMQKQLEMERARGGMGRWEIFRTKSNRKRALIGFLLMFCNQLTGVLIIANYSILLYYSLGFRTYHPLLLSAIWVTCTFPGNIFASLFLDRLGRRTFLLIGTAGILISLIGECITQSLFLRTTNTSGQRAAVFFIFLFIFFYSFFIDATQYLYVSEIFPTHLRAQGMGISLIGFYMGALILLVAGPIALQRITWRFFIVFIVMTTVHLAVILWVYPETKQRSLEDIGRVFGDEVAVSYYEGENDTEKVEGEVGGTGLERVDKKVARARAVEVDLPEVVE